MRRSYYVLPVVALMLWTSQASAFEEYPVDQLPVQGRVHRLVHGMEFGFGSLWTITSCGATLVRVDPASNEPTDIRIHEISSPQTITIGEAAVWISDLQKKAIFKIDPNNYSVLKKMRVPTLSNGASFGVGEGAVWAVTAEGFDRTLTRLNSQSGQIEARISLPSSGSSVIVAYGFVWVAGFSNELYQIDPSNNTIGSIINIHEIPRDLAAGEGSIWILSHEDSAVQRIEVESGNHLTTIQTGLPSNSGEIATGGGYAWVSMQGVPVTQIDPRTNRLLHKFVGGHGIGGFIRYGAGSLWIAGGRISRFTPPKKVIATLRN
jgi:virginiamycin B lyase